ncbi:MAG: N-formylglutamate amidohydrolase [Phycisphaerales bacterium JB050]
MAAELLTILVTCEHAGNQVPAEWKHLFASEEADLALHSHRGWDLGALKVAGLIARQLCAPLLAWPITRLLVEPNRSLGAPDLFSRFSRSLNESDRQSIIDHYYRPYRASVERLITALVAMGHRVLHLGIHSCTDELNGRTRDLELGLLFDPDRRFETEAVNTMHRWFDQHAPEYRVRLNEPYRGTDDGLTTFLRTCFPDRAYAGLELEFRQGHIADETTMNAISDAVARAVIAI